MNAFPYSAVVFDLDGTLIDSAPDVRHALNRLMAAEGRPALSLSEVQGLVGEGARVLIERAFAATGAPLPPAAAAGATARYLAFYEENPVADTEIYPHAVATLQRLAQAGVRLGLCTNKPYAVTLLVLEALGLKSWFAAITGGDSVPRRKPDGDHILETLRRMGADPGTAVMVGDSATDIAAARDAGIPVIAVRYGYAKMPPEALGADALIDGLDQLWGIKVP